MDSNKIRKYILYALGEIILIVLGILIALEISNRNLERQERKVEQKLLQELKGELEFDLQDLKLNLASHRTGLQSSRLIQKWIESKSEYNDSMNVHFGRLTNTSVLIYQSTSYENLKSLGINIIRNDSIRFLIGKVYNYDLHSVKEMQEKIDLNNWYNRLEPYYNEHFRRWIYAGNASAIPVDPEFLQSDPMFSVVVFQTILAKQVMIGNYNRTINSVRSLVDLIEEELKANH